MLREIDNQTISILARESENFLSKKSFAIVRDENWFKWRAKSSQLNYFKYYDLVKCYYDIFGCENVENRKN